MTEFQNTIDLLGDEAVARKFVDRTIENFADDCITNIPEYCLYYFDSSLRSLDLPSVTNIGYGAFQWCKALEIVNVPKLKGIGSNAFSYCTKLNSADFPLVESVGTGAFDGCSSLKSVNLPMLEKVQMSAFYNCAALTSLDFPKANYIYANAFNRCKQLSRLVLRSNTLCTLGNTNAFDGTPFAAGGTGGTVYVPQALITQYQNATNWSTLYAAGTCNFVAIEGSEYE